MEIELNQGLVDLIMNIRFLLLNTIIRAEGQWTCSVYHCLVVTFYDSLVFIAKWSAVESIIDISEKVAGFERGRHQFYFA